ncbi:MAG: helix-turn-helix transcriptional regulator [Treponemataceae bacterium]
MEYLSVIIAFLSLLSGSFIIIGIALYGKRFGDRGSSDLLPGMGLLFVMTLVYFAHARFPDTAQVNDFDRIMISAAMVCRLCLGFVWIWFMHKHLVLNMIDSRRLAITPYFAVLTVANIFLYILSCFVTVPWANTINSVVLAVCLFYAAGSGVVILWKHLELLPSTRTTINVAALSLIIYPLVSLADVFNFPYPLFRPDFPVWFQSQPFYFLAVQIPILWYMKHGLILERNKKSAMNNSQCFNLSAREREVAELLFNGGSYKEIAYALNISMATVKTHVVNIYEKTKVKNKAELIRLLQSAPSDPAVKDHHAEPAVS